MSINELSMSRIFGVVDPETCQALNVRDEPNVNSNVIDMVFASNEIEILEVVDEEWYKICTAVGLEGYSMKQFIIIEE